MGDIIDQYRIETEPYYRTVSDEVTVYEAGPQLGGLLRSAIAAERLPPNKDQGIPDLL